MTTTTEPGPDTGTPTGAGIDAHADTLNRIDRNLRLVLATVSELARRYPTVANALARAIEHEHRR